jgi:hypothetical protein
MDRAITIPGTRITIGLDALLGMLPVGGDVLTGLIQLGIVLAAMFYFKVPRAVAVRMMANVLLDTSVGAIPFVGDVFDVFFKANTRNLRLLNQVKEDHTAHREVASWKSVVSLTLLVLAVLAILGFMLIGFITVALWLFRSHPLV